MGSSQTLKWLDQFVCGDAETLAEKLSIASIDTIVTSPPYYQQRDYGDSRQVGSEPTPAEYVARLIQVFQALRPAMKPQGTAWVVLGDKYLDNQLLGMPWRFALAMQDSGWLLRSDCIWHKPNAMPSPVKSRPTTDHEYVFLFSLNANYYYDSDAIREPHVTFSEHSRMRGGRNHFGKRGGTPELGKNRGDANLHNARWDQAFHPKGRNKRTVWSIPLSKFRESHFAVFPEKLVETCILATCPAEGIVLDPFAGSGTTAVVARKHHRYSINFDCNLEYCEIAERRLRKLDKDYPLFTTDSLNRHLKIE